MLISDWSADVCSSDLGPGEDPAVGRDDLDVVETLALVGYRGDALQRAEIGAGQWDRGDLGDLQGRRLCFRPGEGAQLLQVPIGGKTKQQQGNDGGRQQGEQAQPTEQPTIEPAAAVGGDKRLVAAIRAEYAQGRGTPPIRAPCKKVRQCLKRPGAQIAAWVAGPRHWKVGTLAG